RIAAAYRYLERRPRSASATTAAPQVADVLGNSSLLRLERFGPPELGSGPVREHCESTNDVGLGGSWSGHCSGGGGGRSLILPDQALARSPQIAAEAERMVSVGRPRRAAGLKIACLSLEGGYHL